MVDVMISLTVTCPSPLQSPWQHGAAYATAPDIATTCTYDFWAPAAARPGPLKVTFQVRQVGGPRQTAWAYLMAASVVFVVPVAVVFLLAQRFFIRGITLTGLKQ